jgi:hypothetical protein
LSDHSFPPGNGLLVHHYVFKLQAEPTLPTWLAMYLTEPGITVAWLQIELPKLQPRMLDDTDTYSQASVRDSDGLTFGRILAVAERMCRDIPTAIGGDNKPFVRVWFATTVAGSDSGASAS